MDMLPDSLLLEIFDCLNYEDLCLGVRVTCTRWWRLSQDPTLWKNVQIGDHFTDHRLLMLLHQPYVHLNIEDLECSKCENLTIEAFDTLATIPTPKLKKISMPIISAFPQSIFEKIAKNCPCIEELENSGSNQEENIFPLRIQQMFPSLKVVHDKPLAAYGRIRPGNAKVCNERRNQWLSDLAEVAFTCVSVEAYHCRRGLEYINDEGLEKISVLFPRLKKIELAYGSITDQGLGLFFANNQSSVTEIIFDKPGNITDDGLVIIADNCPDLTNLKLSRCLEITDRGVMYIVEKCKNLTELHLNNKSYIVEDDFVKTCDFTDKCVQTIASSCPKMTFFRLFYSSCITSSGIGRLNIGCPYLSGLMLYECPSIDYLCLSEISKMPNLKALVMVGCDQVSSTAVVDLILNAPKLVRFTMFSNIKSSTFMGDISDLVDSTYAKICTEDACYQPSVLRKLTLKGVGGEFIQLLTVLCPYLHTLDLRDGCTIDNKTLNSVIKNCENLKTLDIQNVDSVDESVLDTICEHAPKLRRLSLGRCVRHLSNTSLVKIISNCPSLKLIAMDTKDTDIDEDLLLDISRSHHGGNAFLHIDYECRQPDNYLEENHRLVELHFTPIKYLSSTRAWLP